MINWIITFLAVSVLSFIMGASWEGMRNDPEDWGKPTFIGIAFATLLVIFLGGTLNGY